MVSPSSILVVGLENESCVFSYDSLSNVGTEGNLVKSNSSRGSIMFCSILYSTVSFGSLKTSFQKVGLKGSGGASLGLTLPYLNSLNTFCKSLSGSFLAR